MDQRFERETSSVQELSFDQLKMFLEGTALKYNTLASSLQDGDGLYNNLALLLSDQCPWQFVLVSKHYGTLRITRGSILVQMMDILETINSVNPLRIIPGTVGPIRKFPRPAIRESILNAMIHCDYSQMLPIVIEYDDEIFSIVSPGGSWLSDRWVCNGMEARNGDLATILLELDLIKLKGRGMFHIKDVYHRSGMVAAFTDNGSHFTVNLPSMTHPARNKDERRRRLKSILENKRRIDVRTASRLLQSSPYASGEALEGLVDEGFAFSMLRGGNRMYYLCDTGNKHFPIGLNDIKKQETETSSGG